MVNTMKMKPHLFCAVAMICACTVENSEAHWKPVLRQIFYGSYDGGGHSLKNFLIGRYKHDTTTYLAGLFGAVCDATIQNLDIQPVSYDVTYPDIEHQPNPEFIVGTLAAYAKSVESGGTTIS